jgi:histidinol-phosphate phosphatase family protein
MTDSEWTLFLDRDGVINTRILGGYVQKWDQFEFLPGVLEAFKILSSHFKRIIIVSNQQGIGKGLMTEEELTDVHNRMITEIEQNGGRIDRIYHSPSLEKEHSIKRKPNVGMALIARKELPGINFRKCFMVGDSVSDMIFGKRLRMVNVLISDDIKMAWKYHKYVDFMFSDLISFAEAITRNKINNL